MTAIYSLVKMLPILVGRTRSYTADHRVGQELFFTTARRHLPEPDFGETRVLERGLAQQSPRRSERVGV